MDNIKIANATEKDLPGILEVYNDAILHTTAVYQEDTHTLSMRKLWFEEKQKAALPVFAAFINEEFAGFSTYGPFRNWPGYRYTIEHSVYVKKDFRGIGVGRKLIEKLIEYAKKEKMHAMIAGIDAAGEASIGLHLSMGFKEVGYFNEVGFKFNKWLDLKFLELILE